MSEPTTVPVADRLHQMDHMLREGACRKLWRRPHDGLDRP
jgi:hypothetical protein